MTKFRLQVPPRGCLPSSCLSSAGLSLSRLPAVPRVPVTATPPFRPPQRIPEEWQLYKAFHTELYTSEGGVSRSGAVSIEDNHAAGHDEDLHSWTFDVFLESMGLVRRRRLHHLPTSLARVNWRFLPDDYYPAAGTIACS